MPLVEVDPLERGVTEQLERADPPHPEQELLSQPGRIISTVESVPERGVLADVVWVPRVEEVDRDDVSTDPPDLCEPDARVQRGAVQGKCQLDSGIGQMRGGIHLWIGLRLITGGIEMLPPVPLSIEKGDGHQVDSGICGRLDMVSRENPQAAGVGVQVGPQPDLGTQVCHGHTLRSKPAAIFILPAHR